MRGARKAGGLGGGISASLQYLSVDAGKNADVLFLARHAKDEAVTAADADGPSTPLIGASASD